MLLKLHDVETLSKCIVVYCVLTNELVVLLNLHDLEMQCLGVLSVVFAYTFGGFHFLRCFTLQDIRNSAWRQNATFLLSLMI